MRSYGCRHSVGPSLLQYCVLELLLRHAEFRFLPAPKENFSIVFAAALHQVNRFWIEGVVVDRDKRHGRTSLAAILPVRWRRHWAERVVSWAGRTIPGVLLRK